MIRKDLTSQICWKSVTILSLLLVTITAVIWFAHTRLSVDNNPSTHIFIPKNNR